MKTVFIFLAITFSCNCSAQKTKSKNKAAATIYKEHLLVGEGYISFLKRKNNLSYHLPPGFDDSIIFLEEITNIKSDISEGFDWFYAPSKENYQDWKVWYKLNRKNLYLDSSKVKIKDKAKSIIKNPIKYYKKKLKLIKKSIKLEFFEDPEYSDTIYFLRDLTGIKRSDYQEEIDVPSEKELALFKNWLKQNKHDLFWDIKNHTLGLRKSTSQ